MIAIFGGSFDPPHLGHELIIDTYFQFFPKTKKFFIVPNYLSPFKEKKNFTSEEIFEMLELVIESKNFPIEISKIELNSKNLNYTIDTIEFFKSQFPAEEIYFLIGEDILDKFHLWKNYNKILSLVKLIIFKRFKNSHLVIPEYISNYEILENKIIEVSSTEIRNKEKFELLNLKVRDYLLNSTKPS